VFCVYCGKPNPDSASFCSTCGKAVALPPAQAASRGQQLTQPPQPAKSVEPPRAAPVHAAPAPSVPVPPQRRSHALRNLTWIAAAIAAAIIVAILLSGPSPEDSLEKAGTALLNQDAQTFDNYVDVQSVLGDWTDQAASSWLISNNSNAGDTLVVNGLVAGFKTLLLPKLAPSVKQEVLSQRISDQPQSADSDNATNYMTNFVSSGIHALITSQLRYQGIASQTKSGSDAVLDLQVGSPLSRNPLVVKVRMQRVGDHWRIIAIPDVARLLAQLQPAQ
jgi:hypothetical protein